MRDIFLPARNPARSGVGADAGKDRQHSFQIDNAAQADRSKEQLLANVASKEQDVVGAKPPNASRSPPELAVVDCPRQILIARKSAPSPKGFKPDLSIRVWRPEERIPMSRMRNHRDLGLGPYLTQCAQAGRRRYGVP